MRGPAMDLLTASAAICLTSVAASTQAETSDDNAMHVTSPIRIKPIETMSLYPSLEMPMVATPFRTFATEPTVHHAPTLFRLQKRSPVPGKGANGSPIVEPTVKKAHHKTGEAHPVYTIPSEKELLEERDRLLAIKNQTPENKDLQTRSFDTRRLQRAEVRVAAVQGKNPAIAKKIAGWHAEMSTAYGKRPPSEDHTGKHDGWSAAWKKQGEEWSAEQGAAGEHDKSKVDSWIADTQLMQKRQPPHGSVKESGRNHPHKSVETSLEETPNFWHDSKDVAEYNPTYSISPLSTLAADMNKKLERLSQPFASKDEEIKARQRLYRANLRYKAVLNKDPALAKKLEDHHGSIADAHFNVMEGAGHLKTFRDHDARRVAWQQQGAKWADERQDKVHADTEVIDHQLHKRAPMQVEKDVHYVEQSGELTTAKIGAGSSDESNQLQKRSPMYTAQEVNNKSKRKFEKEGLASTGRSNAATKRMSTEPLNKKAAALKAKESGEEKAATWEHYKYSIPPVDVLSKQLSDEVQNSHRVEEGNDKKAKFFQSIRLDLAKDRINAVVHRDPEAAERVAKHHGIKTRELSQLVQPTDANGKANFNFYHSAFPSFHKAHMKKTEWDALHTQLQVEKKLSDLSVRQQEDSMQKRSPMYHHESSSHYGEGYMGVEETINRQIAEEQARSIKEYQKQLAKTKKGSNPLAYTYKIPSVDVLKSSLERKQKALEAATSNGEAGDVLAKLENRVDLAKSRIAGTEGKDPEAAKKVMNNHADRAEGLRSNAKEMGLLQTNHADFSSFNKNVQKADQWKLQLEKIKHGKGLERLNSIRYR